MMRILLLSFAVITLFYSCDQKEKVNDDDRYDRTLMVETWVDDFIIPGYQTFHEKVGDLSLKHTEFQLDPSVEKLENLRESFLHTYRAWQSISMFEIGQAETIGLRNFVNTYPTDTSAILENIADNSINLELPSTRVSQGLPALDYLFFSIKNEDEILAHLTQPQVKEYIDLLILRLSEMMSQAKDYWTPENRQEFTNNRESVDRMVNDFLFYYERYLRAGKVGIPAGVFSGDVLPTHVEGAFSKFYNRDFLQASILAVSAYFNAPNSLKDYLVFLAKEDIATEINAAWEEALAKLQELKPSLETQLTEDPLEVLAVYDSLQKAVVLLKVDMLQALSIQVDYVDADGD